MYIDFRTLKENAPDAAGTQVNKLDLGRRIFHLECSLNSGRITHKQQCNSHTHTIAVRCGTNFRSSARPTQMELGGVYSVPIYSFPFISPLASSKGKNNAGNVNEQFTSCKFVPFSGIPSPRITEICGPLSPFETKMCLEEQQFPCSWKTQIWAKILPAAYCHQWGQDFSSCTLQKRWNSLLESDADPATTGSANHFQGGWKTTNLCIQQLLNNSLYNNSLYSVLANFSVSACLLL